MSVFNSEFTFDCGIMHCTSGLGDSLEELLSTCVSEFLGAVCVVDFFR